MIKELQSQGISASTLLLPTCNLSHASILDLKHLDLANPHPSKPWPDMYADAHAIRKKLTQLVEAENSVLLVVHPYGGLPASEALLPELCLQVRRKDGKPGGVIGIFAIASFFLPAGMTTVQAVGGEPLPTTPEQVSNTQVFSSSPRTTIDKRNWHMLTRRAAFRFAHHHLP